MAVCFDEGKISKPLPKLNEITFQRAITYIKVARVR